MHAYSVCWLCVSIKTSGVHDEHTCITWSLKLLGRMLWSILNITNAFLGEAACQSCSPPPLPLPCGSRGKNWASASTSCRSRRYGAHGKGDNCSFVTSNQKGFAIHIEFNVCSCYEFNVCSCYHFATAPFFFWNTVCNIIGAVWLMLCRFVVKPTKANKSYFSRVENPKCHETTPHQTGTIHYLAIDLLRYRQNIPGVL